MLPVKKIERFVKNKTKNPDSVVHDFSHLRRTAVYSEWFVRVLGGSRHEQKLAYIAGLLHDIVRPPTQKISHAYVSADESEKILEKFRIDKKDIRRIAESIRCHSERHEWKDALHQSVFLADKIMEQMGAFVVFRRCMYVAESKDLAGREPVDAIVFQFRWRLAKFNPSEFPRKFLRLAKYQYKWPYDFLRALEKGEGWAYELALYCYNACKARKFPESVISNFRPKTKEQKALRRDAVSYIKGRKFRKFEAMIRSKD